MKTIAAILSGQGRRWVGKRPATEAEISALQRAAGFELPPRYLELLRTCNGGEGDLALAPLWFLLYDTRLAKKMANDDFYRRGFEGLFFFGSNGGLESIAFDMRSGRPWPIVMVDRIAGPESAQIVTSNIEAFVDAIGLPAPE